MSNRAPKQHQKQHSTDIPILPGPAALSPAQAATPAPFALFGSRPTTPQQQEEEEEVQVSAAPALPFANLFGAKQAPVQVGGVAWV
jgi:hypothetical protein